MTYTITASTTVSTFTVATSTAYVDWSFVTTAAISQHKRQAELAARKIAAEQRAKDLLMSLLDSEQAKQYQQDKYFEVLAKGGNRRYRIHHGMAGNVTVYEGKRAVEKLCIHTRTDMPNEDNMLAQKLMLETNEDLFRKTANITRLAA